MKSIVGYVMFTKVKADFCFVLFCTQIITVQLVFPLWEATSLLL